MKISVEGLWHLGLITAASLSSLNHKIIGFSKNDDEVKKIKKNDLPIYEKNLNNYLLNGVKKKKINFTSNLKDIESCDVHWFCYDTTVNKKNNFLHDKIINVIKKRILQLEKIKYFIISSQLPVGTCQQIENFLSKKKIKKNIIYIPENLRLGNAIDNFLNPDRIIVGCRNNYNFDIIKKIFKPRKKFKLIKVKTESAELIKHSINCFLALSISFINEIDSISNQVGAKSKEIELGLKSEKRIGPRAYLSPGGAFSGGTLERDVRVLKSLSDKFKIKNQIIKNIIKSNENRKKFIFNYFKKRQKKLNKKKILIIGLSYKPNSSTTRLSLSLELARWFKRKKINFYIHDPIIKKLGNDLDNYFVKNLKKIMIKGNYVIIFYPQSYYSKYSRILSNKKKIKTLLYDPYYVIESKEVLRL